MNGFLNRVNKNLFVALLGIGVALSLIGRVLLEGLLGGPIASAIAIMICLLCLSLYYSVGRRDSAGLHNPDNLYYMGLLFTLASLVYSLITLFLLNANEGNIEGRVHNLIGSFGIALISTFAGILFRILLLQKLDLVEPTLLSKSDGQKNNKQGQEEVRQQRQLVNKYDVQRNNKQSQEEFGQQKALAHHGLNEAAFKLRMELTQTIADMGVFRRSIVQAANETVQEMGKAHTAMIQQMEKTTQDQIKIFSKLSNGGEKIETTIDSILEPLQEIVNNLKSAEENIRTLASEYSTLNSDIRQSMTFFTNIESEIEQASKTLAAATKEFSSSLSAATEITPQYTHQFEQLITTLRQEAEQWQSMTQRVRSSLVQAVESLTQIVKRS